MAFTLQARVSESREGIDTQSGEVLHFITLQDLGFEATVMVKDAAVARSFQEGAWVQVPCQVRARTKDGAAKLSIRPLEAAKVVRPAQG